MKDKIQDTPEGAAGLLNELNEYAFQRIDENDSPEFVILVRSVAGEEADESETLMCANVCCGMHLAAMLAKSAAHICGDVVENGEKQPLDVHKADVH